MKRLATPDEIRLESERRLAISTVEVILCLNLAVMILDLRAAGPALASVPPVIALRLVGIVLAAVITGVLTTVKTQKALEVAVFFAAISVVALVITMRSVGPPNIARALTFDLVYIATLFVALPTKPALQMVPVTLLGIAEGVRLFDPATVLAEGDRVYYAIIFVVAVSIGYIATKRRHEMSRDLAEARNAEVGAARDAERARAELQTLRGIIPICSHCHRVRIEDGRLWEAVDMYVSRRTDAAFSHGVCPDCLVEHYPTVKAG